MFVRSRIDKPITYRKNGKCWTLKPHAVTLISDPTVTAKELKGCYGSRIDIISEEGIFTSPKEGRQPEKNVVKSSSKPVNSKVLDDILDEVIKELDNDNKKVDNESGNKPVGDESVGNDDDSVSKLGDSETTKEGSEAPKPDRKTKTQKAKSTKGRKTVATKGRKSTKK